jgi:hypothetical protein
MLALAEMIRVVESLEYDEKNREADADADLNDAPKTALKTLYYTQRELLDNETLEVMIREIDCELAAKEDRVKVLESTDPIAGLGQSEESTPKTALHYTHRELLG